MGRGAYSAGTTLFSLAKDGGYEKYVRSQGIASSPTAKKKLNRKSITVATIPAEWPPSYTVPARIAMHAHCPAAAKSIRGRRPSLKISLHLLEGRG
jgi:hypothetical protein